MKDYMNQKEMMDYFDISENTLMAWRRKGLPVISIGQQRYYESGSIHEFLKTYEHQNDYEGIV